MWTGQFRSPLHQNSLKKGSSSNEIIPHKVSKINGSERTLEKTTAHLHSLQGFKGTILGTIWIVPSQTFNFKMYYFITWWTFVTECWCNGLLNCVPFTYQERFLGYRYTLIKFGILSSKENCINFTAHRQGIHIIVSYICIVHTSFSYTRKFVMWTFGN